MYYVLLRINGDVVYFSEVDAVYFDAKYVFVAVDGDCDVFVFFIDDDVHFIGFGD